MFRAFFKSKKKIKLIFSLCRFSLWRDVFRLMKKGAVAEEFLVGLADTHHQLKPFVPLGIDIANQQVPNESVITILKQLKQNGCALHLFSNIGAIIFDDLRKKFPEPFTLFESFSLASRENNYLRKPDDRTYELFLKTYNPDGAPVILIDDKKRNTRAAKKHGIISIFFESTKQLQQELQKLNILHV